MFRRPPRATRSDTHLPYTPLFRSPERRVIQYALFDRDAIEAPAVTDAEVADYFKANAARYAASQTRRFAQVIAPDRKTADAIAAKVRGGSTLAVRSEEHTSELQSLMRISYAVFCLKKKK